MTNPVQVTQDDWASAEKMVNTLLVATEPTMLSLDEAKQEIAEHFARHRCDRIAELEAAVTRLTLALEMERGRGQPRAEHDRRFPDLGPSGEVEVEQIVEWLRGQAAIYNDQNPDLSVLPEWTLAQKWANAIERGEHRSATLTPTRTYAKGIEDAARCIEAGSKPDSYNRSLAKRIRSLGTKP